MCLVEVSAVGCKLCPIHGQALFNSRHQSVETPYSAEQFWCEANLLSKQLNEVSVAEPGFQLNFPDAKQCIGDRQLIDRVSDRGMNRYRGFQFAQQVSLDDEKLRVFAPR